MADEKLNTGPGEEKLPEALLLLRLTGSRLRLPNRPPLPHPSMRGLPSPSPVMWWCPLTKSMS